MIACPACGHTVARRAVACPLCGQPDPAFTAGRRRLIRGGLSLVGMTLAVFAAFVAVVFLYTIVRQALA